MIILDNGHGSNTSGKCSPDKTLFEYQWNREIVAMIHKRLSELDIKSTILVPETTDISLSQRVKRANKIYSEDKSSFLISVHINAAGSDGQWHNASGWSVWVSPKSSSRSKKLAQLLYSEAERLNLKGNRSVPSDKYWTGNFTIISKTNCPAVLTENLFQDNKSDVSFLLSKEGKEKIVDLHIQGILKYLNGNIL